jgi:hypothetical protein
LLFLIGDAAGDLPQAETTGSSRSAARITFGSTRRKRDDRIAIAADLVGEL